MRRLWKRRQWAPTREEAGPIIAEMLRESAVQDRNMIRRAV